MREDQEAFIERVRSGDPQGLAILLEQIEKREAEPLLRSLYPFTRTSQILRVVGPRTAERGKEEFRARFASWVESCSEAGKRVAVLSLESKSFLGEGNGGFGVFFHQLHLPCRVATTLLVLYEAIFALGVAGFDRIVLDIPDSFSALGFTARYDDQSQGAAGDSVGFLAEVGLAQCSQGVFSFKELVFFILCERLDRSIEGAFLTSSGQDLLQQMQRKEIDPYAAADLMAGV